MLRRFPRTLLCAATTPNVAGAATSNAKATTTTTEEDGALSARPLAAPHGWSFRFDASRVAAGEMPDGFARFCREACAAGYAVDTAVILTPPTTTPPTATTTDDQQQPQHLHGTSAASTTSAASAPGTGAVHHDHAAYTGVVFRDDHGAWQAFADPLLVRRLLAAKAVAQRHHSGCTGAVGGEPAAVVPLSTLVNHVTYSARGYQYTVDIAAGTQTNMQTGCVRPVRFIKAGDSGVSAASAPSGGVVEVLNDHGRWAPFSDVAVAQQLLAHPAAAAPPSAVVYRARGYSYVVDVPARRQTNLETGCVRAIRFVKAATAEDGGKKNTKKRNIDVEFADDSGAWQLFTDAAVAQQLLAARKQANAGATGSIVTYSARGYQYTVDIAAGTQTNMQTGCVRPIRFVKRSPLTVQYADEDGTWRPFTDSGVARQLLDAKRALKKAEAAAADAAPTESAPSSTPVDPIVTYHGRGYTYRVDVAARTQTNLQTGVVRPIRITKASSE